MAFMFEPAPRLPAFNFTQIYLIAAFDKHSIEIQRLPFFQVF